MPKFLKKFLNSIKNLFLKTTLVQKLIIGGAFLFVVVAFIILIALNTSSVPLFTTTLDIKEMAKIVKKLEEDKIPFTIKNGSIIFLRNEKEKNKAIMTLAQNGLIPTRRYTFQDIIKSKNITPLISLENIRFRVALEGQLEELLEASYIVESAKVNIIMPLDGTYLNEKKPVKVVVVITPKYGVLFEEYKASIKGIEGLIVNLVDGATKENVVITDNFGVVLNDFSSEETDITTLQMRENLKIKDKLIRDYRQKIEDEISQIIPKDRFSVIVDIQISFDGEKEDGEETILPVILKKNHPSLPYDDGDERIYSIPIKATKETDLSNKEIIKDLWKIKKIIVSVVVDGTYEIQYDEKGKVKTYPDKVRRIRKYIEVSPQMIKNIKNFVEQYENIDFRRGDKVYVYEMQKDRSEEFYLADIKWKREQQIALVLLYGIIGLVIIIFIVVAWRLTQKKIQRQKMNFFSNLFIKNK